MYFNNILAIANQAMRVLVFLSCHSLSRNREIFEVVPFEIALRSEYVL